MRTRRKIAATIWHTPNQKVNIYTGVVDLGMNSTADAKQVAFGLSMDAVNYLGETCLVGISGTGIVCTRLSSMKARSLGQSLSPVEMGNSLLRLISLSTILDSAGPRRGKDGDEGFDASHLLTS